MQKISDSTTTATPDGEFTNGNRAGGVPATVLQAAWFNTIQRELVNLVEGAGIALDVQNDAQVLAAVRALLTWGGLNGKPDAFPPSEHQHTWEAIEGKPTEFPVGWGSVGNKPTTLSGFGITDGIRVLGAGVALPNTNVGPIWHADYNSLMTWQVFNANGANYTGYASVLIGSLLLDTQPTPRAGHIKSGVANLSRTTYAALRAWAQHNGRMVAAETWVAGHIVCADNPDGATFRVYDVRGEFLRAWDDGRGADPGRPFGAWQPDEFRAHQHVDGFRLHQQYVGAFAYGVGAEGGSGYILSTSATTATTQALTSGTGGSESRPRNVPLLASIKY